MERKACSQQLVAKTKPDEAATRHRCWMCSPAGDPAIHEGRTVFNQAILEHEYMTLKGGSGCVYGHQTYDLQPYLGGVYHI